MAKESPAERELKAKVKKLVTKRFRMNYKAAFNHYGGLYRPAGKVGSKALEQLLEDANIGYPWTRGRWVTGVMKKLDKNKDSYISWHEFESVLKGKSAQS